MAFLPHIDDNNIHSSVLQYKSHIDAISDSLKCICSYCVLFILEYGSGFFFINNPFIYNSIILVISKHEYYNVTDNAIYLCSKYNKLLSYAEQPKSEILNDLP